MNVRYIGLALASAPQSKIVVLVEDDTTQVNILPHASPEKVQEQVTAEIQQLDTNDHILIITRNRGVLDGSYPPHVAVVTPYDHFTEELLAKAVSISQEQADEQTTSNPDRLTRAAVKRLTGEPINRAEIFTDASARSNSTTALACYGWVKKTDDAEPKFFVKAVTGADINTLEARAILSAINTFKDHADELVIHSDSRTAISLIQSVLDGKVLTLPNLLTQKQAHDLHQATVKTEIVLKWVPSHTEEKWNALADQIVRHARNLHGKKEISSEVVNASVKTLVTEFLKVRKGN